MSQRTLADWLAWQETLHPSTIELGLERVRRVAERLPFFSVSPRIKTIIVGGTNGKGSCVAYLEAILIAAGYRVGAYSSPHLLVYNERVRVNGAMANDQQLCESFERVDHARRDANGVETSLTYFEFGTLAALDIFYREHVDVQILEVGLGGRLDAVNIMEPDAAIVTNVALDHEQWLGNTRELIGAEKAGIFRGDIPIIIGEVEPPVSLRDCARRLSPQCTRIAATDFALVEKATAVDFFGRDAAGKRVEWKDLPKPVLPLPSAACALQVVLDLQLADRMACERGLTTAQLPGRFQLVTITQGTYKGRRILLDVAHNPAGAQFLTERVNAVFGNSVRLPLVFSALVDKDHVGLVANLAPIARSWYVAPLAVPRATPLATLAAVIRLAVPAQAVQQFDTLGAALVQALATSTDDASVVLVCGSFYTVAAALDALQAMGNS